MTYIPPLSEPVIIKDYISQIDSFGRKRVSQLRTQIDIKHTNDERDLFIEKLTNGAATIARDAANSMMTMTTTNSGDYAIAKTYQSFAYLSGKSSVIYMTFSGIENTTDVIKRVGYFSSSESAPYTADIDGIYLETDGTDLSFNVAKNGTINKITQSNWNIDKLDGTGDSGVTLDISKAQILVMDFEYLGTGGVRFGFVVDNETIYAHIDKHANISTTPYMLRSNQPLRWELRQNGATAASMNYICAMVASEGDTGDVGESLSVNSGTTQLDANVIGTRYNAVAIRLKSTITGAVVNIDEISTLATTVDNFLWEIVINPTIAGTSTFISGGASTSVEYVFGDTTNTVTGGTVLHSGYGKGDSTSVSKHENSVRIGTSLDGTKDIIALVITPLGANLDLYTSLDWTEIE
jgi:hypothetical protein